jgi:uncharacterized membrane protein
MSSIATVTGFVTLLATGLMAGLFYAYSVSVIWGLGRADPRAAIDSMNGISVAILNPLFLTIFMGVPVLAASAAYFFWQAGQPVATWMFAGSAIVYTLGTFAVTMGVNVPMNEALGTVKIPQDISAAREIWNGYASGWMPWNHLRAVAATLSLLLAAIGLYLA